MGLGQWNSNGYGLKPPPLKETYEYEGFRDKIYKDTQGYPTIGFGHKLTQQEIKSGVFRNGISKQEAMNLYKKQRASIVNRFYEKNPQYKNAPESTRRGLEDIAYNMGPDFLSKFPSMKKALDQGDYKEAGKQLITGSDGGLSRYAKQVKQRAFDNAYRIALGSGDNTVKRNFFDAKSNTKYYVNNQATNNDFKNAQESQNINNAMLAGKLRQQINKTGSNINKQALAMSYYNNGTKQAGLGGQRIAELAKKYKKGNEL